MDIITTEAVVTTGTAMSRPSWANPTAVHSAPVYRERSVTGRVSTVTDPGPAGTGLAFVGSTTSSTPADPSPDV